MVSGWCPCGITLTLSLRLFVAAVGVAAGENGAGSVSFMSVWYKPSPTRVRFFMSRFALRHGASGYSFYFRKYFTFENEKFACLQQYLFLVLL